MRDCTQTPYRHERNLVEHFQKMHSGEYWPCEQCAKPSVAMAVPAALPPTYATHCRSTIIRIEYAKRRTGKCCCQATGRRRIAQRNLAEGHTAPYTTVTSPQRSTVHQRESLGVADVHTRHSTCKIPSILSHPCVDAPVRQVDTNPNPFSIDTDLPLLAPSLSPPREMSLLALQEIDWSSQYCA